MTKRPYPETSRHCCPLCDSASLCEKTKPRRTTSAPPSPKKSSHRGTETQSRRVGMTETTLSGDKQAQLPSLCLCVSV